MSRPGFKITHHGPAVGVLMYWFGKIWMRLFGWKVAGSIPQVGKFVIVAAPHTSNWDLPFMMAASSIFRLKVSWMGKHTLFKAPFGRVMRWLGGIPIDRSNPNGVVAQMVRRFNESKKLVVAISPSGTRKKVDFWKSGFYWIAHNAQIPLVCGYLDFTRKMAGFGISFIPSGNVKQDMEKIRRFYDGVEGKNPEIKTTIALRDERT